jgi:hypothetical protein
MWPARSFPTPFEFYIDRMTVKHRASIQSLYSTRNDFLALLGLDLIETLQEE